MTCGPSGEWSIMKFLTKTQPPQYRLPSLRCLLLSDLLCTVCVSLLLPSAFPCGLLLPLPCQPVSCTRTHLCFILLPWSQRSASACALAQLRQYTRSVLADCLCAATQTGVLKDAVVGAHQACTRCVYVLLCGQRLGSVLLDISLFHPVATVATVALPPPLKLAYSV